MRLVVGVFVVGSCRSRLTLRFELPQPPCRVLDVDWLDHQGSRWMVEFKLRFILSISNRWEIRDTGNLGLCKLYPWCLFVFIVIGWIWDIKSRGREFQVPHIRNNVLVLILLYNWLILKYRSLDTLKWLLPLLSGSSILLLLKYRRFLLGVIFLKNIFWRLILLRDFQRNGRLHCLVLLSHPIKF
jgi:hypothetical protein